MGFLTSPALTDAYFCLSEVLLAKQEITREPVKATIFGGEDDAQVAALHLADLTEYKRAQ